MDLEAHLWDRVDDPDRFARIWKRVMPEEREFCPIELIGEGAAQPGSGPKAPQPRRQDRGGHAAAPFLRRQIMAELNGWQACLALSRQGSGLPQNMAARKLTHARRLSAAYFLLTGIQFLPTGQVGARQGMGRAGLAERLRAEEENEKRYRQAAEEMEGDATLSALFRELAGETAAHAARVRSLLEGRGMDGRRGKGM